MARLGFILQGVSVVVVFLAALACASGTNSGTTDGSIPGTGGSGSGFGDQPGTTQPTGGAGSGATNDPTNPVAPVCGNNLKETGELCDGTDLAGTDCNALQTGYSGTISCEDDCLNFDTTMCYPPPETVDEAGVTSDGGPGY